MYKRKLRKKEDILLEAEIKVGVQKYILQSKINRYEDCAKGYALDTTSQDQADTKNYGEIIKNLKKCYKEIEDFAVSLELLREEVKGEMLLEELGGRFSNSLKKYNRRRRNKRVCRLNEINRERITRMLDNIVSSAYEPLEMV